MRNFIFKKLMLSAVLYVLFVVFEMITLVHMGMSLMPTFWYIDIGVFLLISFIAFILPLAAQVIVSIAFLIVHYIFCLLNACIYSSTNRVFDWGMLGLLGETAEAASMVVIPFFLVSVLTLLTIAYIVFSIFIKRRTISPAYSWFIKRAGTIVCCVFVGGMIAFQPIASNIILNTYDRDEYFISPSFSFATMESASSSINEFGFWGYYFNTAVRGLFPSATPNLKIDASWYGAEDSASVLQGLCAGDNVVFFLAESFEQYGISKSTTPVLYALQNGVDLSEVGIGQFYDVEVDSATRQRKLFRKDFDYDQYGNMTRNTVDLFEGLELGQVGLKMTNYKSIESTNNSEGRALSGMTTAFVNSKTTLPAMLGANGYITNYVHANYGDFYRRDYTMKNWYCFENLLFFDQMEGKIATTGDLSFLLKDSDVINYYLANENEFDIVNNETFFTFMMTVSTHGRYDSFEGFELLAEDLLRTFDAVNLAYSDEVALGLYNAIEDERLKNGVRNYMASAIDTEIAVALVIDELFKTGELNDTVLAFVSDHNAWGSNVIEFKETYVEKVNNVENWGDMDRYVLPCFIYSTKIKKQYLTDAGYDREISHLVTSYDFAPTLFTLLDIQYDERFYLGYPVINRGVVSGEELYNKVGFSDTNGFFFDDNCTILDGEYLRKNYGTDNQYVSTMIREINNFQRKRYYLIEMQRRGLL